MDKFLTIRQLESADASVVAAFMRAQSPEYLRFFYAFGSDESKLAEILAKDKSDIYSGVFWQKKLVGIFMLRGWDEGYEIPSFGFICDEKYRGKSIFGLCVDTAKVICRLAEVSRIMVKMHPDNISVKTANRLGMYQKDVEESTGNIIYFIEV